MKSRRIILYLFYLVFCTHVHASMDVRSANFTVNEGLADNLIRHIYQDSKGFVWIGTLNGLTRYDGFSFKTFRPERGKAVSLADRHVWEVEEDPHGLLWIKTETERYSCFDLKRNAFVDFTGFGEFGDKYTHRFQTSSGDTWLWHESLGCREIRYRDGVFTSVTYTHENGKLPTDQIFRMLGDEEDRVWICTSDGLVEVNDGQCTTFGQGLSLTQAILYKGTVYALDERGTVYRKTPQAQALEVVARLNSKDLSSNVISDFVYDDNWVVITFKKIYVFNLSQGKLVTDHRFALPKAHNVWDQSGNLWLYNQYGQVRYIDMRTGRTHDFDIANPTGFLRDSRGLLWIATYGHGLYMYDPQADKLHHHECRIGRESLVPSNFLLCIREDRSGTIWVGTESAGISHLSVFNNGTSRLYLNDDTRANRRNLIQSVAQLPDGTVYVGNRSGELYTYDAGLQQMRGVSEYPSPVAFLTADNDKKLWIGTSRNGLLIDNVWHKHNPEDSTSLALNKVSHLLQDYRGRMWVATFGGGLDLAIPSRDGRYTFRHFLPGARRQQEVRVMASDRHHWMWVGTDDGVCVFHPDSLMRDPDRYYWFTYDNGYLPGNEIKSILCDSRGRVWIGSMGGGVSMYEPDGVDYAHPRFVHYTTKDGLINDMVQTLVEDRQGCIWIATHSGLSRLRPDSRQFDNFLLGNSTLGNAYSENDGLLLTDKHLLLGTDYGLVWLDPDKIETSRSVPQVVMTDLKINGVSVSPSDEHSPLDYALSYTETLRLAYDQNSFVAEFSTLDYQTLRGTKYTYRLDGFDKEWSEPSSLNFAAYKNLSPGEYTLRVRACNAMGTWNDRETVLPVVIAPPFWHTGWAYLAYVLLLGGIVYLTYRTMARIHTLRNRIRLEKQLTEYKLAFFTNISHEFRTPLTLIRGALEKIESQERASQEIAYPVRIMKRNTLRMLRLVNQLLEFRKVQSNKAVLCLEQEDVIAFLRVIYESFVETAEKMDMRFDFVTSADAYPMYFDKEKLDKMVYNLLSNAFKYTPAHGTVTFTVVIDETSDTCTVTVADTGRGIAKDKQSRLFSPFMQSGFADDSMGIGLYLTRELAVLHKGTITFRDNEGGGAVFTLSLPLGTSAYAETDFAPSRPLTVPEGNLSEEPVPVTWVETTSVSPLNKKKILVIEDDLDVREFLKTELGAYFEVLSESDGLSGLKRARTCEADLIICDVLMPGMKGYEVTKLLKNNFETSHIPIILLTAMSTSENELEGVESGADAYVTKPFSLKLLLAKIVQLIRQREMLRDKFSKEPGLTEPICTSDKDKQFIDKMHEVLERRLSDPDFDSNEFASAMNLGRTTFFQKVRGVTGYSPNEFIRIMRMKKAAELLLTAKYNVSEASYEVGFRDPGYFSKCFREHFGVSPSGYAKKENR